MKRILLTLILTASALLANAQNQTFMDGLKALRQHSYLCGYTFQTSKNDSLTGDTTMRMTCKVLPFRLPEHKQAWFADILDKARAEAQSAPSCTEVFDFEAGPEHNYFSRPFPKASVFGATFRSPEHPRRTIVVWSGEENNTSITGAVYDFTFQQPTNDSILGSRIATSREKELLSTYIRLQEAYAKEIAKIAEHEFTQMQARSKAFSLDSLTKGYSLDSLTRGYSLESITKGYSISDLTKGYSACNLRKQTSETVFKTFNRLSKLVRTDPEQAEDAALSILLLCKEDGKKLDGKERDLLGKLLSALIADVAASETIPNPAAIHHYLSVAKVYL